MKKVVIFGAYGLIGQYLTKALAEQGMQVLATGRKNKDNLFPEKENIKTLLVDITKKEDFEKLPKEGIDVVILLAAYLPANMEGYQPEKYIEVNTIGALNVLEYCRKNKVKQIIN